MRYLFLGDVLGVHQSNDQGTISRVDRNKGVRMYKAAATDNNITPADIAGESVQIDFLVEAYVIRPKEIKVKKIYDRMFLMCDTNSDGFFHTSSLPLYFFYFTQPNLTVPMSLSRCIHLRILII